MHPWPSYNGRTRNAASISIWVCTPLLLLPLSRLHHFNCLSVGNKQSLCPLMWGHKRKVRGHIKKISDSAGIVPLTCKLLPTPLCTTHKSADVHSITINASCMIISAEEPNNSIYLQVIWCVTGLTSDFLSFVVVEPIRFLLGALQLQELLQYCFCACVHAQ